MEKDFDVIVIGAGVIGLSISYELSKKYSVGLIEKNKRYGLETSSRNSEVIHSGIHYPTGSLKAKLCVQGNELLYEFLRENNILHKKTGKLTVVVKEDEIKEIERLYKQGIENGVPDVKIIEKNGIKSFAPEIEGVCALYTASTGILNVHYLMDCLYEKFLNNDGIVGFDEKVINIEKKNSIYLVETEKGKYYSEIVINSAGLYAEQISNKLGFNYEVFWVKGDYFTISKKYNIPLLIYPVPMKEGLGIHLTPRLDGFLRVGPDVEYVEKNYPPYSNEKENSIFKIEERKKEFFYNEIRKFLPEIKIEDLNSESYGIRPKLQKKGEGFKDFVIKEELSGFINLIGIDSPGLTCCLSIAKYVKNLIS
ncbi:MAG: NAD(P)/FAD-dependent oxidoreductase [Candidatus Omnitrophica bacterium]|nr:NAD(P)/FAD-dependent oxidoreductase [Candidatus Omnitrophota bacterium]MCM8803150.1 NAD(P)/FAD-dependent oxidoreductase [Candidatus Omnitrophota bacterium]